ncbi:MAG: restriction endonuclease [Propionivibrio sp.]
MSQNSLFAILLRSHWWISLVVALFIVLLARLVVPEAYASYALSFAVPFVVIAAIAAWKQRHVPGEAQVRALVERVSPMGWAEFSALLEDAYRRQGGTVTRVEGGADLLVERSRRLSVVAARRWKAASHGLPALRELVAERERRGAHEALYVALNPLSDKGLLYAREHGVVVVDAAALASLFQRGWLS